MGNLIISRIKRSRAGQLVIVVPLSLAITIGGSLLWGYMSAIRMKDTAIKSSMDLETIANAMLKRVEKILADSRDVLGNYSFCTGAGSAAINNDFSQFRDIGTMAPQTGGQLTVGGAAPYLQTTTPIADIPCILTSTFEKSVLSSVNLTVSRIGDPSLTSRSTNLQISISLQSVVDAIHPQMRTVNLIKKYVMQTATLANYGLILRPPNATVTVANPQLSVAAGARLEIMSTAFDTSTTPFDYMTIAPITNGGVVFDRPLDVMATRLGSSSTVIDVASTVATFRGGINFGVYKSVSAFLPVSEVNLNNPAVSAWNAPLDYAFVYSPPIDPVTLTTASNAPPLPQLNPGDETITSNPTAYNNFVQARAAQLTTIPDPMGVVPQVSNTCVLNTTIQRAFIFQRATDNFNINFDTVAGDNVFCGMIAAETVTINAPNPGTTYALYAIVIARRIVVTGSGKVVIVSPADNVNVTAAPLVAPQSPSSLYSDFMTLGSGPAFNFFVTIFNVPPPAALGLQIPYYYTSQAACNGVLTVVPPPPPGNLFCLNSTVPIPDYSQFFPPYSGAQGTYGSTDWIPYTLTVSQ